MNTNLGLAWRNLSFSTWIAVVALLPIAYNAESAGMQEVCSPGSFQAEEMTLGELLLPEGAMPYTRMTLSRLIVQPGDTHTPAADEPELYLVESGSLDYEVQPYLGVVGGTECVSDDGSLQSSGGTIVQSAEGFLTITQGQALIAEHGIKGSLVNNGTTPLVLLRVSVVAPEIDPATGLPIVDPATLGREQARARDEMKQACKAEARSKRKRPAQASPSPDEGMEPHTGQLATPAASTDGWSGDTKAAPFATPRACDEP